MPLSERVVVRCLWDKRTLAPSVHSIGSIESLSHHLQQRSPMIPLIRMTVLQRRFRENYARCCPRVRARQRRAIGVPGHGHTEEAARIITPKPAHSARRLRLVFPLASTLHLLDGARQRASTLPGNLVCFGRAKLRLRRQKVRPRFGSGRKATQGAGGQAPGRQRKTRPAAAPAGPASCRLHPAKPRPPTRP